MDVTSGLTLPHQEKRPVFYDFLVGREKGRETLRDVRETHDEWLVVRPTNRLTQYDRPTNKPTEPPYISHTTSDHKNKENIRHTMHMCSKKGRKTNGEYVGNMTVSYTHLTLPTSDLV